MCHKRNTLKALIPPVRIIIMFHVLSHMHKYACTATPPWNVLAPNPYLVICHRLINLINCYVVLTLRSAKKKSPTSTDCLLSITRTFVIMIWKFGALKLKVLSIDFSLLKDAESENTIQVGENINNIGQWRIYGGHSSTNIPLKVCSHRVTPCPLHRHSNITLMGKVGVQLILPITVPIKKIRGAACQCYVDSNGVVRCEWAFRGNLDPSLSGSNI